MGTSEGDDVTVSERRKGLRGQQEVQRLFRDHGIVLDKLSAQGDRLMHRANGGLLHIEVKRQERLQLKQWIEQADAEAAPGAIAVVAWRQSREQWRADLALTDLLRLVSG
jgi:ABC-type lipoprotein release transport system permease subunit